MIRQIIKIDEEKCNGCGACASACHEGAISMVDGKARLAREDYCDGLGDCLPACPTGAITFETREAPAYDEAAVLNAKIEKVKESAPCACPGQRPVAIARKNGENRSARAESELTQWPVQIKLLPLRAPYYDGANLLISADCAAYAYGNFHADFIKNHIAMIGCPKLDEGDYAEKLTHIIAQNDIKSVTIVRMEVPCCRGLENAVKRAILASGKFLPWRIVVISADGQILS